MNDAEFEEKYSLNSQTSLINYLDKENKYAFTVTQHLSFDSTHNFTKSILEKPSFIEKCSYPNQCRTDQQNQHSVSVMSKGLPGRKD